MQAASASPAAGSTSFSIASRANRANEMPRGGGALLGPLDELLVSLDQDLAHRGIVTRVFDATGRSSAHAVRRSESAARRPFGLGQYPARGVPEPVAIIGATGALASAWRCAGAAPACPSSSARATPSRAARPPSRARAAVPDGRFEGSENAEAAAKADVVLLSVPFRNQSETLTNLKGALQPRASSSSTPPSRSRRGRQRQAPRACSACGRAPPPSRPRRWSPTACASSARCTPSARRVLATSTTRSTRTCSCAATAARTRTPRHRAHRAHRRACAASTPGAWRWRASPSRSPRC